MEQRGHAPTGRAEIPAESSPRSAWEGRGLVLHLLEYKAQLQEAVQELHIRREAETRFEDQISQVLLEKQELEWEKESLQQQMKTAADQHLESLAKVRKQLQERVRSTEEEKERVRAVAELSEKEAAHLKEELKGLQLLKYSLEKKAGELERKLALQVGSREAHLSQVGELEKRVIALSRQCAVVKQAHGSLEQRVQEAMMTNKKLAAANEKQQATVLSLTEELELLNGRLMETRTSSCRPASRGSTLGQQQTQQLQLKMSQQAEVNKSLQEENLLIRAEKQEVVKAMQRTQQLLLTQTQTVCRLEQELQVQEELFQALQLGHERSAVTEEELPQLTAPSARSAREDEARRRAQTRDPGGSSHLQTLTGPPGEPCSSAGDPVLRQDPGTLDSGTLAKFAADGASEDQTRPSGSVSLMVSSSRLSALTPSLPSGLQASTQCPPAPNPGFAHVVCEAREHSPDTGATDLEAARPVCSSQLSESLEAASVEDLAPRAGGEGKNETPCDTIMAAGGWMDGGDRGAAAETADTALTQTTDRAAGGEDRDGGNRGPRTQTKDRAEEAGEKTETPATGDNQSDTPAAGTSVGSVGTGREDARGGPEEQKETGGSDPGHRVVSDTRTSETVRTQSDTAPASGSDAFTDPSDSTRRPLAETEARRSDWSAGGPAAASAQCPQDGGAALPVASRAVSSSAPAGPASRPTGLGGCPGLGSDSGSQPSTLRAQISKLEQLLGAERLRLPKRRRADD